MCIRDRDKTVPSSGYGLSNHATTGVPRSSTCLTFLSEYSPVPHMTHVGSKAHLCHNARVWAPIDRLHETRVATASNQICSAPPTRPGTSLTKTAKALAAAPLKSPRRARTTTVSYTHLRTHYTVLGRGCRLRLGSKRF
eukprot:TRINITY_DN18190_c0_g1_i1.p1 TRINITY_DN18190_c0_g1~~TRINITY_DN18190_c0_g1_i1.p1  ORF type:complete len:139 (-),score=12.93 TRINITY_DN18190_c0_g1_i1:42-458(-)